MGTKCLIRGLRAYIFTFRTELEPLETYVLSDYLQFLQELDVCCVMSHVAQFRDAISSILLQRTAAPGFKDMTSVDWQASYALTEHV